MHHEAHEGHESLSIPKLRTTMLENFRGLRANFLDDHGYATDFIERIRSHHEDREAHEVEGQEDYF
jgi:hypothetical protein